MENYKKKLRFKDSLTFTEKFIGAITFLYLIINCFVVAIFGYSELIVIGTKWYVSLGLILMVIGVFILRYSTYKEEFED